MESAKDKRCPLIQKVCCEESCAWWCGFAKDCAVPLLAGMFADCDVCNNVFMEEGDGEGEKSTTDTE